MNLLLEYTTHESKKFLYGRNSFELFKYSLQSVLASPHY